MKFEASTQEWKTFTVDEIKADTPNALATGPFGSSIGPRFFESYGVPLIRGTNLSEDISVRLNHENIAFMSLEKSRDFERSKARKGDLIFTSRGSVGQVGLIDKNCPHPEYVISNNMMKLSPDPKKVDSNFLYYLFSSPLMVDEIKNQTIGTSVPGFNLGQLRSLNIRLPPLPEQRAIAHILGSLDDKIEANRRMNETLEALASAIFKSWFVDFDPVWAKAEGREPAGMDAETAALFPDGFEETEGRMVPKGWKIGTIDDLAEVYSGKRPIIRYSEATIEASVPLWGGNGPMGFVPSHLIDHPILLTGRVGTLGSVFRIATPCWPSDNTLILTARDMQDMEYLFFKLKQIDFNSLNRGSTQPLLTQTDLKAHPIELPPREILTRFNYIESMIFKKIDALDDESRTLARVRNALLPRRFSGEVRMIDVETMLGVLK